MPYSFESIEGQEVEPNWIFKWEHPFEDRACEVPYNLKLGYSAMSDSSYLKRGLIQDLLYKFVETSGAYSDEDLFPLIGHQKVYGYIASRDR